MRVLTFLGYKNFSDPSTQLHEISFHKPRVTDIRELCHIHMVTMDKKA